MNPHLDAARIEQLLGSESIGAILVDVALDPVALTRLDDGAFLWVNERFCEDVGHPREELIGRTDQTFGFYLDPALRVDILKGLRQEGAFGPRVGKFRGADGRELYAEFRCRLVEIEGEACVVIASRPMTEQVETMHLLQRRDAILRAAAYAAQRFLGEGSFDDQMGDVLARIGEAASADRVFVYQNHGSPDDLRMSIRWEWRAAGLASALDDPDNADYPYEPTFARWRDVLGAGGAIHAAVTQLPETERQVLSTADRGSLTVAPVQQGDAWWGFVGVYHVDEVRAPSEAEADAMKVVASSFGAMLAKREAEARAAEAEMNFRVLVEQLPGAVYIEALVREGKTTSYLSPGYTRMFGIELDQAVPSIELWRRVIHPDDFDRVVAASDRSDESGEPFEEEYRVELPGRGLQWVRDRAVVVRDAGGEPLFWLGLVIDITERVAVEEALRSTEAKLRTLIEQIPFATYVQSPTDPANFYVSPQIEAVMGYSVEQASQVGFWASVIHPEDRDAVLADAQTTDETGDAFDREYRIVDPDGRIRWIHETAVLVAATGDRPAVWQGVFADVTERRVAEEQLREAEERYRTLVERAPAVTYQEQARPGSYPDTTFLYLSPQVEQLLGYPLEQIERDPSFFWDSVIHPDDKEVVVGGSVDATVSADTYRQEYRVIRADGSVAWVNDEATLVRSEQDGTQYWHGFITDITDRKRAEEDLERALAMERDAVERLRALDELKNTFLNAVSHDLRTPLAAIHGLALTLERDDIELEPHETRDLARRIAANSRKLERLVTDLLDLDRLSRGIIEAKRSPMDLSILVRKVVAETDLLEDRSVQVEAEPVMVPVDAPKAERIVENLLANAVRHTPAGSRIWVRVWPEPEGVVLAVEDDGPGVSAELKEAIFEPFRQGESPSRHSPGVGVGLSLVAAFAALHGGRAWVEDREGGGASFRVLFPFPEG